VAEFNTVTGYRLQVTSEHLASKHTAATCNLSPPLALQLLSGGTYSAPYVAVDSHTDPTSDPSGRLLTPCTGGTYAAAAQRGLGSGVRVGHDREHIRCSNLFGADENDSLPWRNLFRGNLDTYFFDRETKPGTARRRAGN